jgi:F0F1-type ATP synthase epsilon subunit
MAKQQPDQPQPKPPQQPESSTMRVKIYAPFKVYFDGDAKSVTATNRVGQFDVLPQHHNFISLLEPSDIIVRNEGKDDFKMHISQGIIHVKADVVRVFLDV